MRRRSFRSSAAARIAVPLLVAVIAAVTLGASPARADDFLKNVSVTLQPQYEGATGNGS